MFGFFTDYLKEFLTNLFEEQGDVQLGLYGPPNGGKTTLANTIAEDWLGEEVGSVSNVAHETREIQMKEEITIENDDGQEITFNLVDTPGIATKIDYEDFMEEGMEEDEAKERAKEATKGVIESIDWLEDMDIVVVVLDSTIDPYSQVNITIMGNLEAREIPVLVLANKTDLEGSDVKKVKAAFPQYEVVGISAKHGDNIDEFYKMLFKLTQ